MELDKILPYDLRRFGIEEVARVGLIQSEETMGLGKRGRAQIGDAINLARIFAPPNSSSSSLGLRKRF